MNRWHRHLYAAAAYLLMAVLFTWPLVTQLRTSFLSYDSFYGGDPNLFVWYTDWTAKYITGQLPLPAGQMVLYPGGVDPLSSFDGPLLLAVSVPIALLTGNAIAGYDIAVLLALAGSAFAAYALALRLTRSYPAALIAGAMFGFSTFMLVRAGLHANLLMIGTLPLLLGALLARGDRPDDWRTLPLIALAASMNALSSWYYAVGGLIAAFLLFAFQYATWRPRPLRLLTTIAVLCGTTALLALPMLLSETGGGKPFPDDFVRKGGARPADFVITPPYVNVTGGIYTALHKDDVLAANDWQPNPVERSSYFGLPLLALVALYAFRKQLRTLPYPGYWLTAFVIFTVLSMGIRLRAIGADLPLPFAALRDIFPMSLVRMPNRLFVPALLMAQMMAAAVIAQFVASGALSKWRGRLIATTFIALLLAERVIFPFPTYTPRISEFHQALAAEPGDFAVADLPVTMPGYSEYNLQQITHGKPITSGEFFYPAYGPDTFAFMVSSPLFMASECALNKEPFSGPVSLETDVWPDLRSRNIRYVVIHNLVLQNDASCQGVREKLRRIFDGVTPYFTDGALTVYRVP